MARVVEEGVHIHLEEKLARGRVRTQEAHVDVGGYAAHVGLDTDLQ